MDEDAIFDKVIRYTDHLDRLLASRAMSRDDYNKALEDLGRWADGKRREIKEKEQPR